MLLILLEIELMHLENVHVRVVKLCASYWCPAEDMSTCHLYALWCAIYSVSPALRTHMSLTLTHGTLFISIGILDLVCITRDPPTPIPTLLPLQLFPPRMVTSFSSFGSNPQILSCPVPLKCTCKLSAKAHSPLLTQPTIPQVVAAWT